MATDLKANEQTRQAPRPPGVEAWLDAGYAGSAGFFREGGVLPDACAFLGARGTSPATAVVFAHPAIAGLVPRAPRFWPCQNEKILALSGEIHGSRHESQ
jgi:hypothetical protein